VRFLVDEQLPPALVGRLQALGYAAEHVSLLGLGGTPDSEIWEYASEIDAIILTKDEDFAARVLLTDPGPKVIWIRLGNVTNRALWTKLGPRMAEIADALSSSDRLVEVR